MPAQRVTTVEPTVSTETEPVQALFAPVGAPDDEVWLPTGFARGPWSPDSLHGGPVAALLTRAAERVEAPAPVRLARLTVELLRPVPFVPLVVETNVVRPGKLVSTVDLVLRSAPIGADADDGELLALGRVQRIRAAAVDFSDGVVEQPPSIPEAATPLDRWPGMAEVTFHANAVEHRFVSGHFSNQGPAVDWMRFRVPVVPGEEPSGWQRAAAFSDFTNGLSSVAPFDGRSVFINPDLTVHLWREPVGEWVCSEAVTRTSDSGIGLSQTALWDQHGRVGTGLQSLLLNR